MQEISQTIICLSLCSFYLSRGVDELSIDLQAGSEEVCRLPTDYCVSLCIFAAKEIPWSVKTLSDVVYKRREKKADVRGALASLKSIFGKRDINDRPSGARVDSIQDIQIQTRVFSR